MAKAALPIRLIVSSVAKASCQPGCRLDDLHLYMRSPEISQFSMQHMKTGVKSLGLDLMII
ncbi:hypothetical protein COY17_03860 [Candidatus Saccharibacteria bacterium CG_4_10_14_0_2_um_filter_52_9]|nr:MAG: hypothetical protein COY17_03860 [Candidatus Saccharibacteria bacterium CG_4_10_14_0_2_um_filter_52_9]